MQKYFKNNAKFHLAYHNVLCEQLYHVLLRHHTFISLVLYRYFIFSLVLSEKFCSSLLQVY